MDDYTGDLLLSSYYIEKGGIVMIGPCGNWAGYPVILCATPRRGCGIGYALLVVALILLFLFGFANFRCE